MKINKKHFLMIFSIILLMILLYCLFDLFRYVQGVNDDTKRRLFLKKKYMTHMYFKGKIINKDICNKCPVLKWEIIIQIDTINEPSFSNIHDRVYQPYYEFTKDSLLHIKVSQDIYYKIKLGNILIKESSSTYIKIDNMVKLQLLSDDSKKWLHDK